MKSSMEADDVDYNSDGDVNNKEHSRLVDAISKLDKTQHIKKPTRSEPTLQSSEFHLVKSGTTRDSAVLVTDLVKVLGKTAKHAEIGKKLRTTQKKTKTLRKPLEKPQAERIQRSIGFDNVKKQLSKWDAIVSKNRVAAHQSFPLHQADVSLKPSSVFLSKFRVKSDLQKELEALKPAPEIENEETEEFPLTLEEIMERRKESAKLRALQSYREAKARRQSKIKSKKFHRIQRREKIKQQLKDFELLQKNDPEAALQQLEELERTRAGERASLRHRSTGKWAQNLQIRAKYDRESRAELAQQLAVSRDLTQKVRLQDTSEEEEEPAEETTIKLNQGGKNPWTQLQKTSDEVADFVSGYRKYWEDQNKKSAEQLTPLIDNNISKSEASAEEDPEEEETGVTIDGVETFFIDSGEDQRKITCSYKFKNANDVKYNRVPSKSMHSDTNKHNVRDINISGVFLITTSTGNWLETAVESVKSHSAKTEIYSQRPSRAIDEMFDDAEDSIQAKLKKKLQKFKQNVYNEGSNDPINESNNIESEEEYVPDLSFKNMKMRPDIDAEMNETTAKRSKQAENNMKQLKELAATSNVHDHNEEPVESIDPNKFIKMKPKHLFTALPDMVTAEEEMDDNDEKENKQAIIAEAFEDDDIVTDFQKEKEDIINKDKPEDIDLSLPGWGSWGGANIKNNRKRKRFTIKLPKKIPRKDANKGDLIVNENPNSKLKEHMVSELPFPFTSVSDFEASVRAPIGTTFIPINASKKLTRPAISTKLGAIIEPMDEDMLVNKKVSKLKTK